MKTRLCLLLMIIVLSNCQQDELDSQKEYIKLTVADGREYISYIDNNRGFEIKKTVATYEFDSMLNDYSVSFFGFFDTLKDDLFFFISSESEFESNVDYRPRIYEVSDAADIDYLDFYCYLDTSIPDVGDYHLGICKFRFDEISFNGRVKGTAIVHNRKNEVLMTFEFDFTDT